MITQKYQAGKGNRLCQRWSGGRKAVLNKVVREGFSGKVTLNRNVKQMKEQPCGYTREQHSSLGRRGCVKSICKGPEVGPCLAVLRYGREIRGRSRVVVVKQ